jgi:hypothetical protein
VFIHSLVSLFRHMKTKFGTPVALDGTSS